MVARPSGFFCARPRKIKKMLAYLPAFVFFRENFVRLTTRFLFAPPQRPYSPELLSF